MAATTTPENASSDATLPSERREPFPMVTPETRLMMRSIPFSHLRGFGSRPDVAGARAKVDTRNNSYKEQLKARSAVGGVRGEGVKVSSVKTDYSHVRSRINTGRRRANTLETERKRPSSVEATPATDLTLKQRRLTQLKRSATLPVTYSSGAIGDISGHRKISAPSVSHLRSLREVKSRVDSSDPHPQVTRQTHTLNELRIVSDDITLETLNPRFHPLPLTHRNFSAKKSQALSFPATGSIATSSRARRAIFVKSATIDTVPTNTSALVTAIRSTAKGSKTSVTKFESEATDTGFSTELHTNKLSANTDMELERSAANMSGDIGRRFVPVKREEVDIVRSKPPSSRAESANREGLFGTGNGRSRINYRNFPTNGATGVAVATEREGEKEVEEDIRGSVSSSESVGVNPEYSNMEVDTDAFSEGTELRESPLDSSCVATGTTSDKIVGFEVISDPTQTTINLFHLLGHKNRTSEETRTDYQDGDLWAINEEEEEEEEESDEFEMEEELFVGNDVTSDRAKEMERPVPQLFIVDENDKVVEKVKTGRRRQSRGSLSTEGSAVTSEPSASHLALGVQNLSLHS